MAPGLYDDDSDTSPEAKMKEDKTNRQIIFWSVLVIALLFLGEIFWNYSPGRMSVLFFFIGWILLLILHELGHAICAKIFGWRVLGLVIGFGQVLFKFKLFNVPVQIRAFPLEGFVLARPVNERWIRFKSASVYFAGPAVHLAALIIPLYVLGWEGLIEPSDDLGKIFVQSLAAVGFLGCLVTLIPFPANMEGHQAYNDGLGIVYSLFGDVSRLQMSEEEEEKLNRLVRGEPLEDPGWQGD